MTNIYVVHIFEIQSNTTRPPRFAIANGFAFGEIPAELRCLTEIEWALLSINRDSSHFFTFFGGQHESIRGYHSITKTNLSHTMECLERISDITGSQQVSVILSGPFTSAQKEEALNAVQISIERCKRAIEWLRANNHLYNQVHFPNGIEEYIFPEPILLDQSTEVDSTDNAKERIMEKVILFPELSETTTQNGGMESNKAFTNKMIMEIASNTNAAKMVSKPSRDYVNEREKDFLMKTFPEQFPYGRGGLDEKRKTKVSRMDCLRNYTNVHHAPMMMGHFILVIHSMWEKARAFASANVQIKKKRNEVSYSEIFSTITPQDLQKAVELRNEEDGRYVRFEYIIFKIQVCFAYIIYEYILTYIVCEYSI